MFSLKNIVLQIYILASVHLSGSYTLPSYEYDCEGTFDSGASKIRLPDGIQTFCRWKFETRPGEKFVITFRHFHVDGNIADCKIQYVTIRVRQLNLRHCGDIQTPYTVNISSNSVTIYSRKSQPNTHFSFEAFLTRDVQSELRLYGTPLTWADASEICKENGGYLADSYPVVSKQLKLLMHQNNPATIYNGLLTSKSTSDRNEQEFWIGKSLTPWVMLRGCVEMGWNGVGQQAYRMSKYSQMSECAAACTGSDFFLLQENSCYCAMEAKRMTFTYVQFKKCNSPCPGMSTEACGGRNVFILYEYYDGEVTQGKQENSNCVSQQNEPQEFIETSCEENIGFTCRLDNGSLVTYNPNIPGRKKSFSWQHALDFCTNLPGSLGMSPVPKYHQPYFSEPYWTTIIRAVDWNYDSGTWRQPEYSFVASQDDNGDYTEFSRNSSEKHIFICQNDLTKCGHNKSTDTGNITSPDYPLPYKQQLICQWHITVNESKVVKLTIVDMYIEESPDCIYDSLLVKENSSLTKRFCGHLDRKVVVTNDNSVMIMFRSDGSVSGKGFIVMWSAVYPPTMDSPPSTEHSPSLSGGAIVGITVASTSFLVLLISFLACIAYKKRHAVQNVPDQQETSTLHNVVYAVSSLNSSNFTDGDSTSYQSSTRTERKHALRAKTSYANDPKKLTETSTNVYYTISCHNGDVGTEINSKEGSKANLLLDSDSCSLCSTDSKTDHVNTNFNTVNINSVTLPGEVGNRQAWTIAKLDELGKDNIEVVKIEKVQKEGLMYATAININKESLANTEIASEISTKSSETTEDDAYLNEGLVSNAHIPHYEEIFDLSDGAHYTQIDQLHRTDTEDREKNIYERLQL